MIRKKSKLWPNFYTLPSNFLSLKVAFFLLALDIGLGIIGYMSIENYDLADAFYMVIITVSTVGYTEVQPLSDAGKLFSAFYIIVNVGLFAYFLSVFSYFVIQGKIYKNWHYSMIKKSINQLEDHVIVCGYGKYGREISSHFEKQDSPFVVIDMDEQKIEDLQESNKKYLYINDDATHDEALQEANIEKAAALIAALGDDSDNLFVVLTARQLNPNLRIISRAKDPKSQKKMLLAGADRVIMPEQIGGFYMATLITKPDAVEFFSFITNEYQTDIGFDEISFEEVPDNCKNKSIRDLNIRSATGANIIGFKDDRDKYMVNPPPDVVLKPGSSFIILGNREQLDALRKYLERV
ncbi:MAG: potassium channel protein MjK1 [Saprospiraceae bacterium]